MWFDMKEFLGVFNVSYILCEPPNNEVWYQRWNNLFFLPYQPDCLTSLSCCYRAWKITEKLTPLHNLFFMSPALIYSSRVIPEFSRYYLPLFLCNGLNVLIHSLWEFKYSFSFFFPFPVTFQYLYF